MTVEWDEAYDGGYGDNKGYSIQITDDNHYLVSGYTTKPAGDKDVWLIKINSLGPDAGTIIWDSTYGGEKHDFGCSVYPTNDKGFIIAGYTTSYGNGKSDV